MSKRLVIKRDKKVGIIIICIFVIFSISVISCVKSIEYSEYIDEMFKNMMKKSIIIRETRNNLAIANNTIENLTDVNNNLTVNLVNTASCLNDTTESLNNAENMLTMANLTIWELSKEISYARMGDSYDQHDPTYAELMQFLEENIVDSNKYVQGSYVCRHFARDLKNDAAKNGIRCAYVLYYGPPPENPEVEYIQWKGHVINAFDTVDKGLIFIEPQTDSEMMGISLGETKGNIIIKDLIIVW